MRIEVLPEARAAEAVALWHAADLTRPWNDPAADLRRALDGPASTVLAALTAERLVGTVMVGHDGHRGWVYYLAVSAPARGTGVGRALMRASEDWLRARSVPKLNLMVRTANDAVAGFYARAGYRRDDVLVLSRRLD